jgi:large subunit ribosomal protein L13
LIFLTTNIPFVKHKSTKKCLTAGEYFSNYNSFNFIIWDKTMKTFVAKEQEVNKKWYLVNAENKVVGRLASQIATRLRGKNKPIFTPHTDTGDFIVVVNAEKVRLTGAKWDKKKYYHHSGYMGGLKEITAGELLKKKPEEILRMAVKRMLPKNSLGRSQLKKLKIYAGPNHPHEAQNPEQLEI